MTRLAKDLWAGRVPLGRTFWEFAVGWNIVAAVAVLFAFWGALSAGAPPFVLGLVYFSSAPFHAVILVAVWRSAGHYTGRPVWAQAARAAAVVWTIVLIAIP